MTTPTCPMRLQQSGEEPSHASIPWKKQEVGDVLEARRPRACSPRLLHAPTRPPQLRKENILVLMGHPGFIILLLL